MKFKLFLVATFLTSVITLPAAETPGSFRFNFADAKTADGVISVTPTNTFTRELGYGYDLGYAPASNAPYFFSVALPEGNHRVTVMFGAEKSGTTNTVKAEARRLMVEHVVTTPGEFVTRSFNVHTRTVKISDAEHVKLKPREKTNEVVLWDDKLTLEFNGAHPGIRALEIAPAAAGVTTIFLAGDSTVCDQPLEPWNSWGQMLPRFFSDRVCVANYAESGEAIKSSLGANRFKKIYATIRPGDYLFVQFGHNDMKDKATNALAVYKTNLKKIVADTRALGATPVLVTSMERKAGVEHDTLAGYPDTVRAVASEDGVVLIDLHATSRIFYKALGGDLDKAFQDGTHHNNYGSYELARCLVEGIRANQLPLAALLAAAAKSFDPAKPDDVKTFSMAESPLRDTAKPDGN